MSLYLLCYNTEYFYVAVRSDFTDFGFMESDLSANKEVMLLIRRNTAMKHLPQHHLLVFNRNDIDSESSRLYIYNAIRNTVSASQGIIKYMYSITVTF